MDVGDNEDGDDMYADLGGDDTAVDDEVKHTYVNIVFSIIITTSPYYFNPYFPH
jgi:hypothetical protein